MHCHPEHCPWPHPDQTIVITPPSTTPTSSVSPGTVREQPSVTPRTTRRRPKKSPEITLPAWAKNYAVKIIGLGATILAYKKQDTPRQHYLLIEYPEGADTTIYQDAARVEGWTIPSVTNFRQQNRIELIVEIP
jgi:hypothetical protein